MDVTSHPPAYPHHTKVGPCFSRPAYRDGRQKKAVKVYTIATESSYLLIFGVPSIDLEQALKDRCKRFGTIERITKLLDYPNKEQFTDVFLVWTRAKRSLDNSAFYGGQLHVCYAPEYETVAECRVKLYLCRRDNARIARKADHEYAQKFLKTDELVNVVPTEHPGVVTEPTVLKPQLIYAPIRTAALPESAPVSLALTCPTGDAVDDARRHWLQMGATFMSDASFNTELGSSSRNRVHAMEPCTSKEHNQIQQSKRPIPEAVMQALSWKPYEDSSSDKPRDPILNPQLPRPPQRNQPSLAGAFVPRCLRTKSSIGKRKPDQGKCNPSQPCKPITNEELQRLSLTLGPERGPASIPFPQASLPNVSGKRIVFHQSTDAKRRRIIPPSVMTASRQSDE